MMNTKMIVIFCNLILIFSSTKVPAQKLTIKDVCKYIEDNLVLEYNFITIEVQEDGYIKLKSYDKKYLDPKYFNSKNYASDLGFFYKDIKNIEIKNCTYGTHCIYLKMDKSPDKYKNLATCLDGTDFYNKGIEIRCIDDQRQASKINNALNYLIEELRYNPEYNKNDSDPFSDYNYFRLKNKINSTRSEYKIPLTLRNGVYSLKLDISGTQILSAILDSGASDVTISKNIEDELIRKGKISKSNYLTPALYKIADGSIIQANRLVLPEIKLGDMVVPNVICSVISNNSSDILLGQSFLKRFTNWQLDNVNSTLILKP